MGALVDLRESKKVEVTESVLESFGNGFPELCEQLKHNGNLTSLSLWMIPLDASAVDALCNLIKVS